VFSDPASVVDWSLERAHVGVTIFITCAIMTVVEASG
jgi:hypothetical protein